MIHAKLLKFQQIGITLKKDGTNPHFNSSYVTLNEVLDKVKKPLNDLGILILQNPEATGLRTSLVDTEDDTKIESFMPYVETSTAQKLGSNNTYVRRYALVTMLGLEDADDDGNLASAPARQFVQEATAHAQESLNAPSCAHGKMTLKTVRKAGPTQGKEFYSCPQPMGKQCDNSFIWADEVGKAKEPIIDQDGDTIVNPADIPF